MFQGKKKFCKNVRKMSGNFTFQPDEAVMFGPDVSVLLNFIKFLAPVLSGKFEFMSGKCQGIVREFGQS